MKNFSVKIGIKRKIWVFKKFKNRKEQILKFDH